MKTIKFIIPFIILALSGLVLNAQSNQGHSDKHCLDDEKIKAEKVVFITDKLDLSVEEAQTFWPIYNEFNKKMDILFTEEHKLYRQVKKDKGTLTDEELTEILDGMIEIRVDKSALELEYHEKFKEVLPIKKVGQLYQSDKEFRKQLLKKYKCPKEMEKQ